MGFRKFVDVVTFKFMLIGVLNTLVGNAVMFLAYNLLELGYWTSSCANYLAGGVISFLFNKHYTFGSKGKRHQELLKFVINVGVCWLVAYGIARPTVMRTLRVYPSDIQDNISMAVGAVIYVVLNYFGQRYIVFREKEGETE